MGKIKTLFRKEIERRIEEVIKVDQHDEGVVVNEIREYVATDAIKGHFYDVYEEVAKYLSDPHEGIGVWVSGFFGSGKSSFAKLLGYTLANRRVKEKPASEWFIETVGDAQITDYLQNINARFPIHAVIFDISMDRGVRTASEKITEVMYKALLRELDYPEDFDLAELEIWLEINGRLDEFVSLFNETYAPATWKEERDMALGISEASAILHQMIPNTFPAPDSWSNSLGGHGAGEFIGRADISANKLSERAFELTARRKPGHGLVFIIDEVGQYVSRSVDKMLDLQGVVQAFGRESRNRVNAKEAAVPCWIVVTSQEKLNEVVDALDSKKIELARLQDRFPTLVDLKQSDIQEITGKRVLHKTPGAEGILDDLYDRNEGRLKTYCTLERTSRETAIDKEEFINLYPYLPYQLELCIDIVAGLRLKRGAQRHIGGSNRTIIKQAQQMLIHPRTQLAEKPIGALVTLDMVYELLYLGSLLPSEVTHEVGDVAHRLPGNEMALKAAKAIALLEAVKDLPRTAHNLAVVLHPSVDADAIGDEVLAALQALEKAQIIREVEDGYKLLTVQEKTWDDKRAGFAPKPKHRNSIKAEIIKEIFSDPKLRTYRYQDLATFRVGLWMDGEKEEAGSLQFSIQTADDTDELQEKAAQTRKESRSDAHQNEVHWVFSLTEEIHRLIEEVYRSREMIGTYNRLRAQNQITPEESACLEDEKQRENRMIRDYLTPKMTTALESGSGFFRGVERDASALGTSLSGIVTGMFDAVIPQLYPKLEMGARNVRGDEPSKLLTAANLNGLPSVFYDNDDGLNLVVKQGNKYVPNPTAEVAKEILDTIKREHDYGNRVTGRTLDAYFQNAPYHWERDLLRLILATLFRAGSIEVTHQGQKYKEYNDPASHQPFTNNRVFRTATFGPRETVNLKTLMDAATHYEEITGEEVDYEEGAIASAFHRLVNDDREMVLPLQERVRANGLPCRELLDEFRDSVEHIINSDAEECVKTLAGEGTYYKKAREQVRQIRESLSDANIELIRRGKRTITSIWPILEPLNGDEILVEKAQELKETLVLEDFYARIESIRLSTGAILEAYKAVYEERHAARSETFQTTIEKIKGHPGFGLLEKPDHETVLSPLTTRFCEDLELSSGETCDNCRATIDQMASDIYAVTQLQREAKERIDRLTAPEEKIAHVRVAELISGKLEKAADVDACIAQLREHCLKLLAEGAKIILE